MLLSLISGSKSIYVGCGSSNAGSRQPTFLSRLSSHPSVVLGLTHTPPVLPDSSLEEALQIPGHSLPAQQGSARVRTVATPPPGRRGDSAWLRGALETVGGGRTVADGSWQRSPRSWRFTQGHSEVGATPWSRAGKNARAPKGEDERTGLQGGKGTFGGGAQGLVVPAGAEGRKSRRLTRGLGSNQGRVQHGLETGAESWGFLFVLFCF